MLPRFPRSALVAGALPLFCCSSPKEVDDASSGAGGAHFLSGGQSSSGGEALSTGGTTPSAGGASQGGSPVATGGTATGSGAAEGVGVGGSSSSGGAANTDGGDASGGTAGDLAGGAGGHFSNAGGGPPTGSGGSGAGGPITVWIAGDSTVANGQTPCPRGWGGELAAFLDDRVTIENRAVGGRSIRTWLYDVQDTMDDQGECVLTTDTAGVPVYQQRWQEMLTGMEAGDYLLIQFGINDGSSTCPRHVGSQAFEEGYALLARAATERGAQPVFITPVSAIACSGSNATGTRGFLAETAAVGQAEGVPVIDLHARSVELYNRLSFCPLPAGQSDVSASTGGPVGEFFCDDHTHFDTKGAKQIAQTLVEALVEQGIGLAEYVVDP